MKLRQNNNEYYNAFKKCLAMSGTNLKEFCKENGLEYNKTYARLKAKWIDVEYLISLYNYAECLASASFSIELPFINGYDRLSITYSTDGL